MTRTTCTPNSWPPGSTSNRNQNELMITRILRVYELGNLALSGNSRLHLRWASRPETPSSPTAARPRGEAANTAHLAAAGLALHWASFLHCEVTGRLLGHWTTVEEDI